MMYTKNKFFEWDSDKAKANALKHGIDFTRAQFAFDDPNALFLNDEKHSACERRELLIGDSEYGVLFVVFTIRQLGDVIRIISARHAKRGERRDYEEAKKN